MRFDVNAPKPHYLTPESEKAHSMWRSATSSRGVLEAYSSQKPQSATVRLSMWKGAPNNAEGKAKQCIGVMMSFCSILLRFLNRTFQNAEIRCSVWKQTEAHWSIAAASWWIESGVQCGVTANLAIWKGYKLRDSPVCPRFPLKTLFKIVEAQLIFFWTLVSVLY